MNNGIILSLNGIFRRSALPADSRHFLFHEFSLAECGSRMFLNLLEINCGKVILVSRSRVIGDKVVNSLSNCDAAKMKTGVGLIINLQNNNCRIINYCPSNPTSQYSRIISTTNQIRSFLCKIGRDREWEFCTFV